MAIITMSTALLCASVDRGVRRYDLHELSAATGESADRVMAPPRWLLSMRSPARMSAADMDVWRVMLVGLSGRINHLAAWDLNRPAPRGTMRGTMTISGAVAIGATSCSVSAGVGQAGTTLKAGDWLQVGSGLTSQLIMVMADATANGSGVISLTFQHPCRTGWSNGAAVTWDKALGHYKRIDESAKWTAEAAFLEGSASIDMMEQW